MSVLVTIKNEESGMEERNSFAGWKEALEWLQEMEGQYTELRARWAAPWKIRQGRE